jgi:cystathionine beta-lyase family protein involved in aluminum resistance
LKGITFAASFLGRLGFEVDPGPFDERSDIVQAITLGSPEKLKRFAQAIQASSPVDSFAVPEPWDMPGYDRQIIMAAGTFVQGSSIELSCDGPFTEPYTAYLQGGLTKEHVMLAVRRAALRVLTT